MISPIGSEGSVDGVGLAAEREAALLTSWPGS